MPNYPGTKEPIKIEDRIVLRGVPGKVAFVLDDDQFSAEYTKGHWEFLKRENEGKGVMLLLDNGDLVLELFNEGGLELKERKRNV
jgi:hypothetical protein